jgi:hypothetical protein
MSRPASFQQAPAFGQASWLPRASGSRTCRMLNGGILLSFFLTGVFTYVRTERARADDRDDRSNRERAVPLPSPIIACARQLMACFPHHQRPTRARNATRPCWPARHGECPAKEGFASALALGRTRPTAPRPAALCGRPPCSQPRPAICMHVDLLPCSRTCGLSPAER